MYEDKYEDVYEDALKDAAEEEFVFESFVQGLLDELLNGEQKLMEAQSALRAAQAKFDIESRKYAVVRDILTERLGHSPYSHTRFQERAHRLALFEIDKKYGRFRFIHMPIGNAVVAALQEVDEPLTLEAIVKRLRDGGIRGSGSFLNRAVNAALMRTGGVVKTEDGKYIYEELPF